MTDRRVATSESRVNFEALWQTWPEDHNKSALPPRLLRGARERKFFADPRHLANVIARIRASRQLRIWRRTAQPRQIGYRPRPNRRTRITAELGLAFSTCSLAQARQIISGCNELEKQTLLAAFFRLKHWRASRLGKELAPSLRRMGI